MKRATDDLWRLMDDEDSHDADLNDMDAEAEQLLEAWYRERSQRIEGSLVLQRVGKLLAELLASNELDPAQRRQARRLLAAIREVDGERA